MAIWDHQPQFVTLFGMFGVRMLGTFYVQKDTHISNEMCGNKHRFCAGPAALSRWSDVEYHGSIMI
jgi:hypothetical protein